MKRILLNVVAGLLIFGSLGVCKAQLTLPSPDTWDFVLSGNRNGTAYMTFFSDGTFTGYEVIVPKAGGAPAQGRSEGGDRVDGPDFPLPDGTQIFGSDRINGSWSRDIKGQIIGFFIEVSALENCSTNAFAFETNLPFANETPLTFTNGSPSDPVFCVTRPTATNDLGGGATNYTLQEICYTNIIVCSAITNAISFAGKEAPGKRLTLKCTTPFGTTLFKGVPAQTLPDITGSYYGTRKQAGVSYLEFFTLVPSDLPFPNIYDVALTGPGYTYTGRAVLSAQRKMSFGLGRDPILPDEPVTIIRAVTGPFNFKKINANMTGWDQPAGVLEDPVRFQIQLSP